MSQPPLRKEFGQHHLLHGEICRPLVEFLRPLVGRTVEIGPGGGILTAELLRAGARVLAWEVDPAWAFALRQRLPAPELEIVVGDALEIPWRRAAARLVTGNLPYNVATALIADVLESSGAERAAFLVQLEVGERLLAGPGDREYGALSVLTRARAAPVWLGRVRRGSFRPPPKVDGAFVGLHLHAPPLPEEQMPAFVTLVRQAFAKRRKTLRNSLAAGLGTRRSDELLGALGWAEKVRAESLGLEEFLRLFEVLSSLGPS